VFGSVFAGRTIVSSDGPGFTGHHLDHAWSCMLYCDHSIGLSLTPPFHSQPCILCALWCCCLVPRSLVVPSYHPTVPASRAITSIMRGVCCIVITRLVPPFIPNTQPCILCALQRCIVPVLAVRGHAPIASRSFPHLSSNRKIVNRKS